MELKLSDDDVAFIFENSSSDTSFCSDNTNVIDWDVYPVMLVTHLGAHAKPKEPDLSLETVIDHTSDLSLNLPTPKDDMKNFSTSCNSQNDLLLQLSNDELDITACAPNMTSSPKCLKVCVAF